MAAETYEGVPCRRGGHTTRYLNGNCVTCANDGRLRASRLWRTYGLTVEDEEALWASTAGKCPICQKAMERSGLMSSSRAVVDHCHASGKVRSIICNGCNRGLGYFGDNPEALEAAASYLRAHGAS